jgi:hypothetical protein
MKYYFSVKSIFKGVFALVLATVMLISTDAITVYASSKTDDLNDTTVYEIQVGETLTLNATGDKVNWKSSDKKVITVSKQGVVTGIKEGNAVVTLTVINKVPVERAKNWFFRILQILFPKKITTTTEYQFNVRAIDEIVETTDSTEMIEETKLEKPDNPSEADEYYWNNSEAVLEVIDVKESEELLSEKEATRLLEERGFYEYEIIYDSSIDGEYIGDTEVDENSNQKYPMYTTYYMAENGDIWTIFVVNGKLFANPASFNLESELDAQLLFSETKELTSYDDETNKFYVTIPKESVTIVKIVEKIDSETLDKLTIEEIKN